MRHLDLFSGIGGFALAASWIWGAKHGIVGFCEIDSFCQKILKKHWPEVPMYSNIKELKGDQFDAVELITGGFPCQPYSVAGKRAGAEDDRHLWPEMFRIIREVRPGWIIAENVPGIVNMELDQVLADLEGEDYTTETFIISACAVDAPHRRDRVWIVANSKQFRRGGRNNEDGAKREIQTTGSRSECKSGILADNGLSQPMELPGGIKTCRDGIGDGGKTISNSNGNGSSFRELRGASHETQGVEILTPEPFYLFNGEPAKWQPEPRLGRVADGIPNRVDRLRGLGNAIVPQVAAVIMRIIKEADLNGNP